MIEDIARALGEDGVRWLRGEKIPAGENGRGKVIYLGFPDMKKEEREWLAKKIERELRMQETRKKLWSVDVKKRETQKEKDHF